MKQPPADLAAKLYGLGEEYLARGSDIRIDDVAKAVSVPRATMYYYFSGKDDLLSFLMMDKARRAGEATQAAIDEGGSSAEILQRLIRAQVQVFADAPSLCITMLSGLGQPATMGELLALGEAAMFTPLREVLEDGRAAGELSYSDVDVVGAAFAGSIMMASLRDYLATGSIDVDRVSAGLSDQLLTGLRP